MLLDGSGVGVHRLQLILAEKKDYGEAKLQHPRLGLASEDDCVGG